MKCPRDGNDLKQRTHETNIEVDLCQKCHGLYLDKGELETIQETIEHNYSKELKAIPDYVGRAFEMARQKIVEDTICPKCNINMVSREYGYCSQIIIDICPQCSGIWLDHGELKALEVFFEKNSPIVKKGFFASLLNIIKK